MKPPLHQRRNRPLLRNTGMTLIEVVIAIGILSFAIVPLLALLPMGFNGYRTAIDQTIETAILQQLAGRVAQMTPNTAEGVETTGFENKILDFDQDGTVVEAGTGLYRATTALLAPSGISQNLSQIRTVKVIISHHPSKRNLSTHVIHVCLRQSPSVNPENGDERG